MDEATTQTTQIRQAAGAGVDTLMAKVRADIEHLPIPQAEEYIVWLRARLAGDLDHLMANLEVYADQ
jgi:hypothetical protein